MMLPEPFRLHSFDRVTSTNDEARRLAEEGAGHATVVWAREQTAGRGRRGRTWYSPPGNLYCSILLDPGPSPRRAPELTFVSSVALREALASLVPRASFTAKWPNDILCGGAKISGILLETAPPLIILGTGVNIAATASEPSYPTTNLAAAGADPGLDAFAVLQGFCASLGRWYATWRDIGFAAVRRAWLAHASGIGGAITVRLADGTTLEGSFGGLDEAGALLLDTPDGARRPILAGDVFFAA